MHEAFLKAIREDIEHYVVQLFKDYPKPELVYHTIDHTKAVVERSEMIAGSSIMNSENRFVLYAAAWFHDTGHLFAEPETHEEVGMHIAGQFLHRYPEVPPQVIVKVERCILSTKMPQVTCTTPENILCDADTFHLGTSEFLLTDEQMKKETVLRGGTVEDWDASSLKLLEKHRYHTNYCRQKLNPGKEANIEMLKARLAKQEENHGKS